MATSTAPHSPTVCRCNELSERSYTQVRCKCRAYGLAPAASSDDSVQQHSHGIPLDSTAPCECLRCRCFFSTTARVTKRLQNSMETKEQKSHNGNNNPRISPNETTPKQPPGGCEGNANPIREQAEGKDDGRVRLFFFTWKKYARSETLKQPPCLACKNRKTRDRRGTRR